MSNIYHYGWWATWYISALGTAIAISDGIMGYIGLPPFLGEVSIWVAGHWWIFITMWIFLMAIHILRVHWYLTEKEQK
jgi:hypothetical protein